MNINRKISRHFELNHLKGKLSRITLPEMVYRDNPDNSGCCYKPQEAEICLDGKFYDLKNGLIVISSDRHSTVAHEWRHLCQYSQGYNLKTIEWKLVGTYEQSIINYFTNSWSEMDALLYEMKMAPDNENLEWYEWIVHAKTTQR